VSAFEQVTNIPVRLVDTTIDVVSRGSGDQPHDDVYVTSQLELQGDIATDQPAMLILPLAAEAQQQPILRYTGRPIDTPTGFTFDTVDRSDVDDDVIDRLMALNDGASKREQRDLGPALRRAAKTFSSTVLEIQPGQRRLRLFYAISSDKVADREFEFTVIGPLPSFIIGAGGSIGVTALLPRGATVIKAEGLVDPANPSSLVTASNATLGGRPAWGWFWQNDPWFTIRYRY